LFCKKSLPDKDFDVKLKILKTVAIFQAWFIIFRIFIITIISGGSNERG